MYINIYNEAGILESLEILSDGNEAFKKELINVYEDFVDSIFLGITISVCLSSMSIAMIIVYYRRTNSKQKESANMIDKLLKKIK